MSEIIELSLFGVDHWSTLLYVESRCVDHGGELQRTDPHMRRKTRARASSKVPTRLNNKVVVENHDDYDCIDDLENAGLCVYQGDQIALTDLGWSVVGQLRRNRAEHKADRDFKPILP